MKKLIIIIIIIGLGYVLYNRSTSNSTTTPAPETAEEGVITETYNELTDLVEDAKEAVEEAGMSQEDLQEAGLVEEGNSSDAQTEETQTNNETVSENTPTVGSYVDYGSVDLASVEGKIVLDFWASWCPSCRKLEKDILASLDDIPAGVTIVKVDYDQETALKQQYGVTRQHTLVQVDQAGTQIAKWSGGNDLESVLAKIQ